MEEVRESHAEAPTSTTASIPKATATETTKPERKKRKPKAAASIAAPVRGCPAPDFSKAELRAQGVLRTFLDPEQIADFNRYNKFVSIGQTTGNRYMITSRHATDELATYTRSLYDLDLKMPLCVHDWDVPASEEMLGLHVLLQLPGWESYLRVSEDNMEAALHAHLGDRAGLLTFDDPFAREALS